MKNKNNIILLSITIIVMSIICSFVYFSTYYNPDTETKNIKKAQNTIYQLSKKLEIKYTNFLDNSTNAIKTDILNDEDVEILKEATSNKNIIFLLDMSGSMENTLDDVKYAFSDIAFYLSENSTVTLISFNKNVYVHMLKSEFDEENRNAFINNIKSLSISNSCCTYNALVYALTIAQEEENSEIILLSDGQISMGYTYDDLKESLPYLNVPINTISYGNSAEFSILEEISKNTNGVNIKATNQNIFNKLKEIIKF